MKMIRWNLIGLLIMAPLILGGNAQEFTPPPNAIPGIQQHLNLNGVHQPKAKKKNIRAIFHGCPKLVAKELHIVRAVPQPGHPDHYSFILDGTIENRGLTGQTTAGFNVSRKLNGRVVHRVALHLFKQHVRHNQRFDLNRDFHSSGALHLPIQSQAISRADANHSTFELSVTNLQNDQGQCLVYNPSVATVTQAMVSRALPRDVKKLVAKSIKPRSFGFNRPVSGPGGKSLLSPQARGGTRHLLDAGIRLDSVMPSTVTAGASITVHGQFHGVSLHNPQFQYRLLLYRRGHDRDNALIHITHISDTALMATVPNHNPGNFLLRVDTLQLGNDLASPTHSNSIPITIRRSLGSIGFAPKPIFGPGSGRPVTGPGGTSLTDRAQVKLTLKKVLNESNSQPITLQTLVVPWHTRLRVTLNLHNHGTKLAHVRVAWGPSNHSRSPVIDVPPGGDKNYVALLSADAAFGKIIHTAGPVIFQSYFSLLNADDSVFHDAYDNDNKTILGFNLSPPLKISVIPGSVKLTVTQVPLDSQTRSGMRGHLTGELLETIGFDMKIENVGIVASPPTTLYITIKSTAPASPSFLDRPHYSYTDTGKTVGVSHPVFGLYLPIPSIPPHGSINRHEFVRPVSYHLWDIRYTASRFRHNHFPLASGAFACGKAYFGVQGSKVEIHIKDEAWSGLRVPEGGSDWGEGAAAGQFGELSYPYDYGCVAN